MNLSLAPSNFTTSFPFTDDDFLHGHLFWLLTTGICVLFAIICGYLVGTLKGRSIGGYYAAPSSNEQSSNSDSQSDIPPKLMTNNKLAQLQKRQPKTAPMVEPKLSQPQTDIEMKAMPDTKLKLSIGESELMDFLLKQKKVHESIRDQKKSFSFETKSFSNSKRVNRQVVGSEDDLDEFKSALDEFKSAKENQFDLASQMSAICEFKTAKLNGTMR